MTAMTTLEPPLAPLRSGNGTDSLYEIVKGKYVELPPMSTYAGLIASRLVRNLGRFADERQLGEVVSEILFPFDAKGKLRRRPDVAFVSYARWERGRPYPHTDPWPVVPELAVEVVSPNDVAEDLRLKVVEYFRAGVQLVWVVYPQLRLVDVFDSPKSMRTLIEGEELDGAPVLTGLHLPLATIFAGGPEDQAPDA